jgi:transcriptional regulator with XRE-family HTH domain
VNDLETLKLIGGFVTAARTSAGLTQIQLAQEAGIDVKTLRTLEYGDRLLHEKKLAAIERTLGWRTFSIRQLWDRREHLDAGKVTMDDLKLDPAQESWTDLAGEGRGPVTKASQLTNEELLMELQYRFRNLEIQVTRLKDGEDGGSTPH